MIRKSIFDYFGCAKNYHHFLDDEKCGCAYKATIFYSLIP